MMCLRESTIQVSRIAELDKALASKVTRYCRFGFAAVHPAAKPNRKHLVTLQGKAAGSLLRAKPAKIKSTDRCRGLAFRIEERHLHHRRADTMTDGLDRDLKLQVRANLCELSLDRRQRDHSLQSR